MGIGARQGMPMSANDVFRSIRNRILKLELEPGQKVSENQMCEEYGVSRSVIRVVFTRLSQLHLVNIYPQRGTYVSLIDLDFIQDLLLLRTAVEKEVLREIFYKINDQKRVELIRNLEENLSRQEEYRGKEGYLTQFKKLDSEFHKTMIDSVKRYRLVLLLEDQMIHVTRWRNFDVTFAHRVSELIDEHQAILNRIKDDDLAGAQDAMATHLETVAKIDVKAKAQYPNYFVETQ